MRYEHNRRHSARKLQLGKAIPLRTYEQIAGNSRAIQRSTAKTGTTFAARTSIYNLLE